ncbi:hypothetical protein EPUS_07723 [Endocarpon pusillum Z07020]|uniref:DUF7165 domain-containing protein n=1 Tax=Endocarpon pusillum (strain Z07020 / HMAS-L-300199) TaxID=1263415 RepID=U1GMM0_ENDPU|nr:uncharacterized protein EPUS_07723 [Endocarpon pusillum Z07020]ERF73518.1 hypothetical protein EPUS_07723 [Endocarpon pusillum Z07020]
MEKGRVVAAMPVETSSLDERAISPRPLESHSDDSLPHRVTSKCRADRPSIAQHGSISPRTAAIFARLPTEVIELILWLSDSNTFASLVFLNRQWNLVSQDAALYAHHLSRCPSYALAHDVITGSSRLNDLTWLKAKFAQEVRRNLFDAFMQPSETLVNLISTSASSSAAFPRGEALRFIFSSHGQTLLALSSSRIFLVDLLSEPLAVTRELKTMRRPETAAVTNDGSLLAVLSTKHQANIYGLTSAGVNHLQIIILDNPPRTIALANEGTVLAAAYEGGVEVFSLAANALSTDRRAVRCEAVDSLSFSSDGSMLIGSSHDTDDSNTVIITAPFYSENDPDLTTSILHSRMWTTQILFPQNSSTCSHAALLNSHGEGDINWLFVYDRSLNTYRAVRADDTRTGVAYFLGPNPHRHSIALPNMLPSINLSGELAVAGFAGLGLFIYGIPERVDNAPDMRHVLEREERSNRRWPMSLTSATGYREPLMAYSPPISETETIEDDFLSGSVDWRQSLFVRSRQLPALQDAVGLIWVENSNTAGTKQIRRRLAVVAPGGVSEFAEELGEEIMPVDGGRILLLDFDYAPRGRKKRTITIEVGEKTPEMLPEQRRNLDAEVALVRRRSIREAVGGSRRLSLGSSTTGLISPLARMSTHFEDAGSRGSVSQPSSPVDGPSAGDGAATNGNRSRRSIGKSRESLQRAVTSTGVSRARYPPRPPLDSSQGAASGHVVYRRTNERREPHEAVVDDWEPPPPYSQNPDRALSDSGELQMAARTFTEPLHRSAQALISPRRASTTSGELTGPSAPYRETSNLNDLNGRHHRGLSDASFDTPGPSPAPSPRRRSEHFSRIQSLASSVSPLSSPRSTWAPGRQTSESSIRMAANILSPMPDLPHPPRSPGELAAPYVAPSDVSSITPPASSVKEGNSPTTLTGANLQNRLNHPVPPRPSQLSQEASATYIPTSLQVGKRPSPTLLRPSPNSDSEPFTLPPPTSDQLANLNKRVSQTRRRPVPINTSQHRMGGVSGQDFAVVPPSPPRAAWGAAGVPGSPSFNKASRSPQTLSRNNSRGSQRSASTPSLLSSRPRYDRLETIESVRSVPPQERARSRSQVMMDRPHLMESIAAAQQRRVATDPKAAKSRKQRRADKEADERARDGKKWRAGRCIVM